MEERPAQWPDPPNQQRDREELESELEALREDYLDRGEGDPKRAVLLRNIGMLRLEIGSLENRRDGGDENSSTHRDEEEIDLRALEALGEYYAGRHRYSSALRCYFECLRMLGEDGDRAMLGISWMEIGTLYAELGKIDRALESFHESVRNFHRGDNYYLETKAIVNVANILAARGEDEVAFTSLLRCLMVFEELEENEGIAETLAGIGAIYGRKGDLASALSYARSALAIVDIATDPALGGALLLNLAELHHRSEENSLALDAIERALDAAARTHDLRLEARLHELASLIHEDCGDHRSALQHHRRFVKLWGEIQTWRGDGEADLEMSFEIDRVRRERDTYRSQAQELRQEVYAKKRELTSLSLNLVRKSEFLEEMRRQLLQIIGAGKEPEIIVRPLLDDLAAEARADNGWSPFEEQLNERHHDFIRVLAERYPTLTPTELKICALTRNNLSTKEIASLLFVTVRNVQNHRYRIRKKFGLDPEANLVSFLAAM
jgi:tetratricopeptide (TPR) repeat protein/DNA-binding CsgD family transcriptional regulator